MADQPIRCISQHGESVTLTNGESEMVPAGGVSSGPVDLSDDNNKRLLDEGLIIAVAPAKKKPGGGTNSEGEGA